MTEEEFLAAVKDAWDSASVGAMKHVDFAYVGGFLGPFKRYWVGSNPVARPRSSSARKRKRMCAKFC